MADSVTGMPRRGRTYYEGNTPPTDANVGQSLKVEGLQKTFNDTDPTVTAGPKQNRSNRKVECMMVRNVSGITLEAKRLVTWATGYRGRRVDGYATIDFKECAGVVDDHIGSAGVLDNDLFWLVRRGPCLCRTPLEGSILNAWSEHDILHALTAVTSQCTTSGRVTVWAATSNLTNAGTLICNRVGRAMSAKTTANGNADVLVDLEIMSSP